MLRNGWICISVATLSLSLAGCGGDDDSSTGSMDGGSGGSGGTDGSVLDPDTAAEARIDRFSQDVGTLMVRDDDNGLPEAGEAIDFDQGPFITQGLGPSGELVKYYNFDVQSTTPAPIYAFFHEGDDKPVPGQLNVVDVIPGDSGYSDFWRVNKVTVPDDYVANTITSVDELMDTDYEVETLDALVNCPIVPDGSSAELTLGGSGNELVRGWYKDKVVYYFSFEEAPLEVTGSGRVPISPIYVTFNTNPDKAGGGPPSGFVTEEDSDQTHNVVQTLPDDAGYSPLWYVDVYDNADFDSVSDLDSAMNANILDTGVANVNCPVVSIEK